MFLSFEIWLGKFGFMKVLWKKGKEMMSIFDTELFFPPQIEIAISSIIDPQNLG